MSESPRILIVEDEPKIARLAADYLNAAGYDLARFQEAANLVVLDLMLPGWAYSVQIAACPIRPFRSLW